MYAKIIGHYHLSLDTKPLWIVKLHTASYHHDSSWESGYIESRGYFQVIITLGCAGNVDSCIGV